MSSAQINQVPTASAFTPLAVPGCALWLDGADQTSMTLNQSTLTNWRDKSGNGYMALSFSNAVSPPTWASNVQNGRGVVQYAVGNGSFVSSFTITPAMTVFALYYPIGQTTNSPPIEQSVNSALNPGFLLQAAANNFTIRGSIPGPSNLVLSNVTMTWNAYTGAQTYTWTLYESTVGTTGPWTQINTAATASTSAAHTPMTIGNYYYFTVIVTTATGVSPPNASTPAQLVSSALLAPTNLSLTIPAGTSATATLAWTGSAGATTYSWILFTSATAAYVGTLLTSGSTAGTSATYGITIGSYNYFSVRAVTSALISAAAFSAIVGQQIVPPTGLAISASGTTVTMSWSAYTAATSYAWTLYSNSIYAYAGSSAATGTVSGSPPATTATYSSAVAGTYYYFTLTVTTPGGTGYTSGPATSSIAQAFASPVASGGTLTTPTGYQVYTFSNVGSNSFTLTSPSSTSAQVLIVGGGGSGGIDYAGGGGAGGAVYLSSTSISAAAYTITVGGGGTNGGNGSNSSVTISGTTYTGIGGGAGGTYFGAGLAGGCGGGAGGFINANTTTPGGAGSQGYGGGTGTSTTGAMGSGGGGMGSAGSNSTGATLGAAGGSGATYTIGGTALTVSGGGGGAHNGPGGSGGGGSGGGHQQRGTAGTPNTGGGGGGGGQVNGGSGAGGSGIVIIALPTPPPSPTNLTLTTSGTAATMSWAAAAGATGYSWTLYQSATNAYAGTVTASGTTTSALTATASTVTPGLYGYFTVAATLSGSSSAAVASAVVYQLPAPPSSLAVTQTGTSIVISWGAVASATAYVWTLYSNTIYAYAGTQVATATLTGNPPTTSYTYSSAVSGTYYYFTVNVTTALGTSVVATSLPAQYTAPVIPTVTATNPSSATITPTIANGYYTYQFTATGTNTFTLTSPSSISAQALVVGGGGAGGDANPGRGGGGGAGGAVLNTISLSSGSYSVIVGGGGNPGFNGVSSSFNGIIGTGGGTCGSNGGCGGGAIYLNPSVGLGSQGGNGGTSQTLNTPPYGTGGGGGMGGNGSNVVDGQGSAPYGVGGPGITYTVGGSSYTVSGGGGGAIGSGSQYVLGGTGGGGNGGYSGISGTPGTANTGGGGGGSWGGTTGGSGIVVIAFPLLATPTSPTLTTSGTAATMSWTAAAGATGYSWTLYQSSTNAYAGTVTATGTTTTATTASASTVTPGQYGYFTVAATSGGSSPAVASAVVYQLPAPPSSLVITPSGTSVAISWGAVSGATTYTYTLYSNTIYAYAGAQVTTASTASTSYTYSSAVSGTYYYFTVNVTTALGTSVVATSSISQSVAALTYTYTSGTITSSTLTTSGFPGGAVVTAWNSNYTSLTTTINHAVYLIAYPSGLTTFIAGGANPGRQDGTGTSAIFAYPHGAVNLPDGNIMVLDDNTGYLRLVTPSGVVTTFSMTTFNNAYNIFLYSPSIIVVCESGLNRLRLVTYPGGVITTLATGINYPIQAVKLQDGNIVTTSYFGNVVNLVTYPGGVVTTLAGNGGSANSDGTGTNALLKNPSGIGLLPNGNIVISQTDGYLKMITYPGAVVTTLSTGVGTSWNLEVNPTTGLVIVPTTSNIYLVSPQLSRPFSPTNPTLTTSGTAATMSWTAAAGATGYSWTFYQSATNAYAGTVTATGTTTSALTATVSSGLTFGNYYYFTVAATASGSSPAVASSVVQYIPAPYNLTLSVISSGATLSWSATGTSPTFYYTLTQTTVNAYTGGTQTTIVSSNTTSTSVTYNFTSVITNYYFFTVYQVTSAYGQSPTYQSSIFNYVWIPTAAAIPLAMWVRGNSGLNTSGGTWTDPNSSTSYTISGTATTVTVNGLSACQFTSGSGTLSNVSVSFSSSARSVFAVIQMPTSLNGATVYMVSGPFAVGNNTMDFRWYANSSTTAQISGTYQGTAILANSTAFTQLPGVPVLYGMVSSSSGTTYYINGTSIGTASAALWVAGGSTLTLNGYTPANTNGNNIFCEVVVYNGALGATDITNCMTYLRNKWGTS